MGDSDDDYDRRRGRDKFRRERNDYNDRNVNNRRDDWNTDSWSQRERNQSSGGSGSGRRDYNRDNYNSNRMNYQRNDRYSPADRGGGGGSVGIGDDLSPPMKRIRSTGRDWDSYASNYDNVYHTSSAGHHIVSHYSRDTYGHDRDDDLYQPPMMTLKQFVNEQDDHLDGEILIKKYNDYKCEFKRAQIQEFFNRHKDEEWFRCKYFPDEMEKRLLKMQQTYQNRLNIFMELYDEKKCFENVSLDVDKAEQIIKVLDMAVIKMEGGTDFDLNALNKEFEEQQQQQQQQQKNMDSIFAIDSSTTTKSSFNDNTTTTTSATKKTIDSSSNVDDDDGENDEKNISNQSIDNNNTNDDDDDDEKMTNNENDNDNRMNEDLDETSKTTLDGEKNESGDGEIMEEGEDSTNNENKNNNDDNQQQQESEEKNESETAEATTKTATTMDNEQIKPRALHKTCSIFFRNIAPSITRQEIEEKCRKFPGFIRLAISEPQMDRRFNRRGWATYERTVNIREICWNLNSVKIRGTELCPIVNRDLTRRIRSINGISSDKAVVRADIRHAAKLIMKLDQQKKLWEENPDEVNPEKRNGSTSTLSTPSRNPLLKNITDYLIEEAPAEEAELLGTSVEDPSIMSPNDIDEQNVTNDGNGNAKSGTNEGTQLERDEELINVLDRLLFYLRIVHSIDYYNHCDYANEDEMPNRIGLVHARGLISSARVTSVEITEYIKDFEQKILSTLLKPVPEITSEEAKKLGLKNIDDCVDAFIKENTKELGEGKWLCPLSNKKFMGPEFVRKHILNKHGERVEQVKAETIYFNNYIMDPKRPQLPEHPLNRPPPQPSSSSSSSSSSLQQQQQHQASRHDPLLATGGPYAYGYNHRIPGLLGSSGAAYLRYPNAGPHPPPSYLLQGQLMDPYLMRPNFKRRYRDLDAPIEE